MKYLIFIFLFSFPLFSKTPPTESVEILNALTSNPEEFSNFLKQAERVVVYKTTMEVIDENNSKFKIFAKKIREGDVLEGEVIWEILKITTEQSGGPDLIKYESNFINPNSKNGK